MPQGEVNPSCAQRIAAEDRNKLEQDELKLKKLKKDGNRDELKKRTREGDAGGGAGRVPREIARVGPPERMASKKETRCRQCEYCGALHSDYVVGGSRCSASCCYVEGQLPTSAERSRNTAMTRGTRRASRYPEFS